MVVQDLVNKINGNPSLGVTGPDKGQCTAVPHYWENMLGIGIVYGNAKDTYANASDTLYIKELNGPSNFPLPGAIVVYGASWGGGYGHTGVALDGCDGSSLVILEQNNPDGSGVHIAKRNYAGVLGWFYPRILQAAPAGGVDAPTADNEGVVNGQGLRAHTSPDTQAPFGWYYDNNEHITILARAKGENVTVGPYAPSAWWYQTDKGWVSDAYVRTTHTPANVPDFVAPAPAPQPPQYSPRPTTGLFGVDVSSVGQGTIDWGALAGQIDFAVIRAGHVGASYGGNADETDPQFVINRDLCRAAGKVAAFYWFCYPSLDPAAEAQHFVNSVGDLKPGCSLWADLETDGDNLVEWTAKFKAEVERLTNRKLRGYFNRDFATRYPGLLQTFGADGIWGADFDGVAANHPFDNVIMHQYTSSGVLPGIQGKVDLNCYFGTLDQFKALGDPITLPTPEPTPTPAPEPSPLPDPVPAPTPTPDPQPNNRKDNGMKNTIITALLEAARLIVFALPGILITVLSSHPSLGNTVIGGLILLVLKAADRAVHQNPNIQANGLLPF